MKKLEDYKGQKIAIHFPTYELWLRRKEINPSDDLEDEYWVRYGKKFYYNPFYNDGYGGFAIEDYYIKNNYTIIPATDFLEDEFIYGQEYEFSDYEDFEKSEILIFGCENPIDKSGYKYIAFTKNGFPYNFKHARKINTERTEAITNIKELVSKFSINQNEIF